MNLLLMQRISVILTLFLAPCFAVSAASNSSDVDADTFSYLSMDISEVLEVEIITAAKHTQKIWASASSITIISAEELKAYGHRTIFDALQTVVSTIPSHTGTNPALGMRGYMLPGVDARMLWLIDGHSLNDSYFQSYIPGASFPIDINNIERIEIVRSPGSVLYGSNAFFGMVNVISKKGSQTKGVNLHLGGGGQVSDPDDYPVNGKLDRFSEQDGTLSFGKRLNNGDDIFVSASYLNNKNNATYVPYFSATDEPGIVDEANFKEVEKFSFRYQHESWQFNSAYSKRKQGRPQADYFSTPNNKDNQSNTEKYFLEGTYKHQYKKNIGTSTRLYYDYDDRSGQWHYEGFSPLDTQENISNWWGLETQLSWQPEKHHVLVAIEYQKHRTREVEDYPSEDAFFEDQRFRFYNLAFYAQEEYSLSDKVQVNLGFRVEDNEFSDSITIGSAAVIYHPSQRNIFRFKIADSFLNVLPHDLFYHSSFLGVFQNEFADLERERIRTTELAWRQILNRLQIETTLYESKIKDVIEYEPTFDLYFNGGGILSRGLELDLRWHFSGGIHAYLNGTYQKSEVEASKEELLSSPNQSIKLGGIYHALKSKQLVVALEAQHYGDANYQDHPARTVDLKQNAYTVANIKLTSKQSVLGFEPAFAIYNLLNESYEYSVAKGVRQSLPAPGRSYRLTFFRHF